MLPIAIKILKFGSVPLLLAGGMLPQTAEYGSLLTVAVCLGVLVAAALALWKKDYYLAAGFVAVAVVFSPFLLVTKIFVLMCLAGIVTYLTLFAAFRHRAVTSENDLQT